MINPDDALSKIATGLSLLRRPSTSLPGILELGIRELQALSLTNLKRSLPASRVDVLALMETPLQMWWPGLLPNCQSDQILLKFGEATSFCMEWAFSLRDDLHTQLAEIDERVMKKILEICRTDRSGFQPVYVQSRRFIIEKPIVRLKEIIDQSSRGNILTEVQEAYEPVPMECVENDSVFLCHYCHDAMIIRDGHFYCRNWMICDHYGNSSKKHRVQYTEDLRRLRRGMMAFVCMPGLPELELCTKLEKMGLAPCLWPGVDEYDLRVVLPDGGAWAVDVKVTGSSWLLGRREARKGFILPSDDHDLHWDQAFYVIADHLFSSKFEKEFWEGAKAAGAAKKKIRIISVKQFVQAVKKEIHHA